MALIIICGFIPMSVYSNAPPDVCLNAGLEDEQYGLCVAYCDAMQCHKGNQNALKIACDKVKDKFQKEGGTLPLPCEKK